MLISPAADEPKRLLGGGREIDRVAVDEFSGVVPVAELVRNSGVRQLDGSADDLAGVVDEPHRRQRRDAFPEPDSPTSPTVSPSRISRSIPSTAFTCPRSVENWVRTSESESRGGMWRVSDRLWIYFCLQSSAG